MHLPPLSSQRWRRSTLSSLLSKPPTLMTLCLLPLALMFLSRTLLAVATEVSKGRTAAGRTAEAMGDSALEAAEEAASGIAMAMEATTPSPSPSPSPSPNSHLSPLVLPFSWDTLPVYFHSMNQSGPWNDDALDRITRYPLATIEKAHGGRGPGQFLLDGTEACRRIISRGNDNNASTLALFYTNSLLDWRFNPLHDMMDLHPDWRLRDMDGHDIEVLPEVWGFNVSVPELREEWIFDCLQAIDLGCHGCFVDRSNRITQVSVTDLMSPDDAARFGQAHLDTLAELNARLKERRERKSGRGGGGNSTPSSLESTPFAINNNQGLVPEGTTFMMIEDFAASERCIKVLRTAVRRGLAVQVHAGDVVDDGTTNSTEEQCIHGDINAMSAFLIGAGTYSYYHCADRFYSDPNWPNASDVWLDWLPEYDRPLGEPLDLGRRDDKTGVWTRTFASGAVVRFDGVRGNGTIVWGDGVEQSGGTTQLKPPGDGCYWQSMSFELDGGMMVVEEDDAAVSIA